jgi:hypothetical protein
MPNISSLTVAQLERAVAIKKQIEALEAELDKLNDGDAFPAPAKRGRKPRLQIADAVVETPKKKRGRKKGWSKLKAAADAQVESTTTPAAEVAPSDGVREEPKKRRKVSRAAKAKMAAAQKARWEKVRAEKAAA